MFQFLVAAYLPCPYSKSADPTKYHVPSGVDGEYILMSCPDTQVWSQELCTCNFSECSEFSVFGVELYLFSYVSSG